jgi:MFS family permease
MISHLIRILGFGWAMRISGFLMLFLLAIANLTIRPFRAPIPHPVTLSQLLKPFRELKFVFITAGFFCYSFGFFIPITYLPSLAIDSGMSADLAQYLLPILNAASLFGRLISGIVGDKIGRYNVFIVVCYLSGVWILALWLPDTSNAALIAFAILFGFFSGALVSLVTPLVLSISPFQELGFRTGIVMLAMAVGGLATNPINGAIFDSAGGATGLKIFSGVFCLAGTTFVLLARLRHTGLKLLTRF